ncbi:MAG TPA: sugar ABC transporter ATP-binding protein [Tepidisphaeraceae bacterium]|jgi:ribose transport system ATP-binding protein|nr:sugar ABC transporter ATP-binding protein [Tepidisphaeraceae bacterium]
MTDSPAIPPRLRMRGIRKRFGATIALDGVDIEVASGEVLALVGENGAGKSTLMKVLSGAHAADEGSMALDGETYAPRSPLDARRRGVAMIYQELSLAPHLSVMENILLGTEPTRGPLIDWKRMREKAAAGLAAVGHPNIPLNLPAGLLSVAEQQLVEVARAVAVGSRVLVLDEPTSSLSRTDVEHLFALIRRLKTQGLGIVYISHFLEEVQAVGDRFTVLRDGRSVGGGMTADVSADEIIAMMVGRDVDDLYPRSRREPGEVVLEVSHLAGLDEPQSASLALRRGEVLGIAGLMGAGRTELLRAIFGLDPVRSGSVRVASYTGPASPARRWSQGIGMVSEDRKAEGLALSMSVAENLALPHLPAIPSPSRLDAAAWPWLDRLNVRLRSPRQPVGDLSGGNQQKVAIARLLHHDAQVLLLDEPTRGIDVASKAEIYRVIDDLACRGKAVLLVSSYLPELLGVCDRIAVMCRGTLGPARLASETNEHQIMAEAIGSNSSPQPQPV